MLYLKGNNIIDVIFKYMFIIISWKNLMYSIDYFSILFFDAHIL